MGPGSSFSRWPIFREQPFPLWLTLSVPVALGAALAIAYLLEETIFGGDWSAGALAVGIASLAMAVGTLAVWGVRRARGRQATSTLVLALILVVVLAGGGLAALAAVTPLHATQARQFEQRHRWSEAIDEFALAGKGAASNTDIARIYVEWGEEQLAQQQYAQAATTFQTVITDYAQTGAPATQASKDLYLTFSAWVKAGGTNMPYAEAITIISTYGAGPGCDASCKSSATAAEAQARYEYGVALASAKRYVDAISQFETVQSKFGSSPFAAQAHTNAAQAYLAYGKQLLTAACGQAVPYYQKLTSAYADTPQGKQAAAALAAPVSVTGILTKFPTKPVPSIYLSTQYDQASYYYSDEYTAPLNTSTGVFTFSKVAQGDYYLNTARNLGNSSDYILFTDKTTGNPFVIRVRPLCTVNLGTISYS
jgi:tetratricopeptide (TPR) repeat protein